MCERALAVVAAIVLVYIALRTWRPWVLAPAIAFTAAALLVGAEVRGAGSSVVIGRKDADRRY